MDFKGKTDIIWMNGKFIKWDDANIHICSHVIHYGTAIFGGIRCYNTLSGSAIFRPKDHVKRLFDSCKIYRMELSFTQEEFNKAIVETVKANKVDECYIRPLVYRGLGQLGVNPFTCPMDAAIIIMKWGKYLGENALIEGVDVRISSWLRMAPNTFPAMAKCSANYMNSQLIKMEAIIEGYEEGIALDTSGHVSEGSGENIFAIKNGIIYTPPMSSSILMGITRDSAIKLARDAGFEVIETDIPREMLYIADEVFFTGSAAEITPIRSIDKIKIGEGTRGPVTQKLQEEFFGIVEGKRPDKFGWLTFVK